MPDVLELVRAHDPARTLPRAPHAEREALRLRVLATPVRSTRTRRVRPLAVAFAALVAALALATAGWGVYESVFHTADDVRSDFPAEAAKIPLPPGAHWQEPNLDEQGLYTGPAAKMEALWQATCIWFEEWDAAFRSGDKPRMTAAAAGFERVRALMPIHPEGASEDVGGYDDSSLAFYDRILREQRRGEPSNTERYLIANCR